MILSKGLIFAILIILSNNQSSNVGMIAYFQGSCPTGWAAFTQGEDKFIIGAGSTYPSGTVGGQATHTLTVNQMPSHNHQNGNFNVLLKKDDTNTLVSSNTDVGSPNLAAGQAIQSAGGDQPHNNMPPFKSLKICKKTADYSANITALQTKVTNLEGNITLKANTSELSSVNSTLNSKIDSNLSSLNTTLNTKIDSNLSSLNTTLNTNINNNISSLNNSLTSTINSQITAVNATVDTKANITTVDNLQTNLTNRMDSLNSSISNKNDVTTFKKLEQEVEQSDNRQKVISDISIAALVFGGILIGVGISVVIYLIVVKCCKKSPSGTSYNGVENDTSKVNNMVGHQSSIINLDQKIQAEQNNRQAQEKFKQERKIEKEQIEQKPRMNNIQSTDQLTKDPSKDEIKKDSMRYTASRRFNKEKKSENTMNQTSSFFKVQEKQDATRLDQVEDLEDIQ